MTDQRDTNGILATIALIIAVVALILAWVAFNRNPGPTLEDRARSLDSRDMTRGVENAAEKTEEITRQGAAEALKKTGEVIEEGGEATQEAGAGMQKDNGAVQR